MMARNQRRRVQPEGWTEWTGARFTGSDIGQISEPDLVRRGCREVPAQPVGGDRIAVPTVRGSHPAWDCGQPAQAGEAHQARDTVAPDASAGGAQHGMDAWRAVTSAALDMSATNIAKKGSVLDAAPALRAPSPSIISTGRYPEDRADRAHWPEVAMLIDEPETHRVAAPKMSALF